MTDLDEEYRAAVSAVEQELATLRGECTRNEMSGALWSEALTVERTAYRDLFDRGIISEPVLRELELSVDLRHDELKRGELPKEIGSATPLEVRLADWTINLLGRLIPKSRLVQRHRIRALAAKYEHEAAVHEAGQRVAAEIEHLAALGGVEPAVAAECRELYERHSAEAMERLDTVAEHLPEYVRAVQRQTARRIALDAEADAIEQLAATGGIPGSVAREARRSLEHAQRHLMRQPVAALEPRPEDLLARVPFLRTWIPLTSSAW